MNKRSYAHTEASLDPNFYFPATHNLTTLPIAENMKPFPVFSPFIVKSYSLELFVDFVQNIFIA